MDMGRLENILELARERDDSNPVELGESVANATCPFGTPSTRKALRDARISMWPKPLFSEVSKNRVFHFARMTIENKMRMVQQEWLGPRKRPTCVLGEVVEATLDFQGYCFVAGDLWERAVERNLIGTGRFVEWSYSNHMVVLESTNGLLFYAAVDRQHILSPEGLQVYTQENNRPHFVYEWTIVRDIDPENRPADFLRQKKYAQQVLSWAHAYAAANYLGDFIPISENRWMAQPGMLFLPKSTSLNDFGYMHWFTEVYREMSKHQWQLYDEEAYKSFLSVLENIDQQEQPPQI